MPIYALSAQRKKPNAYQCTHQASWNSYSEWYSDQLGVMYDTLPTFLVGMRGVMFDTLALQLPLRFAVLPNPVPDRQPCSALCRVSSLGPLPQTEIMAGFPEKVSDWTVIYFYPKSKLPLGYSEKPINELQSLSRKPVNNDAKAKQYFQINRCVASITPMGKAVKRLILSKSTSVISDEEGIGFVISTENIL